MILLDNFYLKLFFVCMIFLVAKFFMKINFIWLAFIRPEPKGLILIIFSFKFRYSLQNDFKKWDIR